MARENALSADNQQGRVRYQLDSWYVSGFVDGEGSFHIAFFQDAAGKQGLRIIPEFHVSQRVSSKHILDALAKFFGCGYVKANHARNPKDVTYVYVVRNRDDLLHKIIPFFQAYPLKTEKAQDFLTFVQVLDAMSKQEHLKESGRARIIDLAYTMNGSGRYRKRSKEDLT